MAIRIAKRCLIRGNIGVYPVKEITMANVRCACGKTLAVKPELFGRQVRCPGCGKTMVVQAPKAPAAQMVAKAPAAQQTVFCNYCHQEIPQSQYQQHIHQHEQLRADGQQTDYATLPPAQRDETAAQAPEIYRHNKCGQLTGMPDDIIATYLENPWFYLADKTFCCGCEKHVKNSECVWTETGENLQVYFDRLRAAKPEYRPGVMTRMLVKALNLFG